MCIHRAIMYDVRVCRQMIDQMKAWADELERNYGMTTVFREQRMVFMSVGDVCCISNIFLRLGQMSHYTFLPRLLLCACHQMVDQMEAWADELGGNYELTMFGKRTVVATNVGDVRRILHLRPALFKRGLSAVSFWSAS